MSSDRNASPRYLVLEDGSRIAYHALSGRTPGVVFLGGFTSDMAGTKATALEAHCRAHGRAYVRFDYYGHGASSGRFEEATIGRWVSDALAVFDRLTDGPQILVGSSMGGWLMVLVALNRPKRIHGLVGVASAPDFTEELIWKRLDEADRNVLARHGVIHAYNPYGEEPTPITRRLIEEGRAHLVLDRPIALGCPMRLLHGMDDADVPWQTSVRLAEALAGRNVVLTLVKGGDHRLSEPQDLGRLLSAVDEVCESAVPCNR